MSILSRHVLTVTLGAVALVAFAVVPAEFRPIARLGIDSTAQALPPGCKQNPDGTLECKKSKPNLRKGQKPPSDPATPATNLNSSRSN